MRLGASKTTGYNAYQDFRPRLQHQWAATVTLAGIYSTLVKSSTHHAVFKPADELYGYVATSKFRLHRSA